jgi:hypothetical protein
LIDKNSVKKQLNQQILYDAENTPTVTSVTPNVLSVLGGEQITITGTNLPGLIEQRVLIGENVVKIISSSDSLLVIESPAKAPGLYELIIPVENIGYAK